MFFRTRQRSTKEVSFRSVRGGFLAAISLAEAEFGAILDFAIGGNFKLSSCSIDLAESWWMNHWKNPQQSLWFLFLHRCLIAGQGCLDLQVKTYRATPQPTLNPKNTQTFTPVHVDDVVFSRVKVVPCRPYLYCTPFFKPTSCTTDRSREYSPGADVLSGS